MPRHQLTREDAAKGGAASKIQGDGVAMWRARSPEVLQIAVVEVFHGRGTPQQSRLVDNWWRARLYDADIALVDLLAASLGASR